MKKLEQGEMYSRGLNLTKSGRLILFLELPQPYCLGIKIRLWPIFGEVGNPLIWFGYLRADPWRFSADDQWDKCFWCCSEIRPTALFFGFSHREMWGAMRESMEDEEGRVTTVHYHGRCYDAARIWGATKYV